MLPLGRQPTFGPAGEALSLPQPPLKAYQLSYPFPRLFVVVVVVVVVFVNSQVGAHTQRTRSGESGNDGCERTKKKEESRLFYSRRFCLRHWRPTPLTITPLVARRVATPNGDDGDGVVVVTAAVVVVAFTEDP
jgi:hypothetical protein